MTARLVECEVTSKDLDMVADLMRDGDVAELEEVGLRPREALYSSVLMSGGTARVLRLAGPGVPVCVYGVADYESFGAPWMLGTPLISVYPVEFMKHSKRVVDRMLTSYRVLVNVVDSRNVAAIRWLKALGFNFNKEEPALLGKTGVPFYYFEMHNVYC